MEFHGERPRSDMLNAELTGRIIGTALHVFNGITVPVGYRVDLFVARTVIVEVKAVEKLEPVHTAQVLTYLRFAGCRTGLILNFNVTSLKDGIRRVVL